jgi:YbbR domain-containing protein
MSKNKKTKIRILPGFIVNDFWRKIIALFFAVLVWERVSARLDESQKIRGIPVVLSMPGYIPLDNKSVKVDIVLRGSQQQLNKITANDIKITLNVKKPKEGINKLIISQKDITVPHGVSIASIEPDEFEIILDEKMTKKVPVKLIYSGALLDGYALNPIHIIPQEVTITGPKSLIDKPEYIKSKPIVLKKDFVEDFDCRVRIDTENKNISVTPKEVSARIEIYKEYDVREFRNVKIKPFGYIPGIKKITIQPDVSTIIVSGLKNVIEVMTTDEIRPFIDISTIDKPGEYTLNVQCLLDNSALNVKEIFPTTVNVKVSE